MTFGQSQDMFHAAFDNSLQFITLMTQEGRIITVNKTALNLYSYNEIDIIGKKAWEIPWWSYDAETQNKLKEGIIAAGRGEEFLFEVAYPAISENNRLFEFSIRPIKDPAGTVICLSMEVGNFTGVEEMESLLKERGEKYRTVVENSLVGVYIVQNGLFRYVNKRLCKMIGYTEEEIVDKLSPMDLIVPEDKHILGENFRRRLSDESECELRVMRKDGDIVFLKIFGSHMLFHGLPAISGTIIDITGYKKLCEALRQSEAKYRNIFENAIEGLFQSTPEGKLISVNSSMAGSYGYDSPEEMIASINDFGKQVFVNPKDRERWRALLEETGVLEGFEVQHYRKDSKVIWCSINARAVRDVSGNIACFEGSIEDISIRKQVENELRKKSKDLENKSRRLEDMNTTLRVLLDQRDEDKRQLEETVLNNIKSLIIPHIERLKGTQLTHNQQAHVTLLETNLEDIVSKFSSKLKSNLINLTPREIEIATQIKIGRGTKEIAQLLNISDAAVERHRKSLRRKFGLTNRKINLQNYLCSWG